MVFIIAIQGFLKSKRIVSLFSNYDSHNESNMLQRRALDDLRRQMQAVLVGDTIYLNGLRNAQTVIFVFSIWLCSTHWKPKCS